MSQFMNVLSKVSPDVRKQFLESMSFGKGKLMDVRIDGVRRTLAEGDFQALMQDCGCKAGYACNPFDGSCGKFEDHACNPKNCTPMPDPSVSLGALLQTTPSNIRRRFLDSLDFENGELTRAAVHLVEAHVAKLERNQLPHVTGTRAGGKSTSTG